MPQAQSNIRVGIDTGGTFTDFILQTAEGLRVHKRLSTPHAPEEAVLAGLADLELTAGEANIIHGSTVATNAVLEGKGAAVAFITNRGFKDLLTIGRQARSALYDLQPQPTPALVPSEFCLEAGGRCNPQGEEIDPLSEQDIQQLIQQLAALPITAVAINFLFSFRNPQPEQRLAAAITAQLPQLFVSRSSAVLAEYKEYERGIATYLNSLVAPKVQRYLQRLAKQTAPSTLSIMQSNGGTTDAERAGQYPVNLLLSGPAGGLTAAQYLGQLTGREQLLTFDMGGTSSDVALIDRALKLTTEGQISTPHKSYPVAVPMVDMHTIGAGGGSIAYLDAGGALQVGPESAGAQPGPACYGQGGKRATVTDANLLCGRLPKSARLAGKLRLDTTAAADAMQTLANDLDLSLEETALAVIKLANEHMAQALRVISVQRGIDVSNYSLCSFGGAGGLHVCALAEALAIKQAIVPVHAGVLSALGMLAAKQRLDRSMTLAAPLNRLSIADINQHFDTLTAAALAEAGLGPASDGLKLEYSLDLRYQGQSYSLNSAWLQSLEKQTEQFHNQHAGRYGHQLDLPIELVNLRVQLIAETAGLHLAKQVQPSDVNGLAENFNPEANGEVYGVSGPVPIWQRDQLSAGQQLSGPAIISDQTGTTWLAPNWRCEVDSYGNLLLFSLSD